MMNIKITKKLGFGLISFGVLLSILAFTIILNPFDSETNPSYSSSSKVLDQSTRNIIQATDKENENLLKNKTLQQDQNQHDYSRGNNNNNSLRSENEPKNENGNKRFVDTGVGDDDKNKNKNETGDGDGDEPVPVPEPVPVVKVDTEIKLKTFPEKLEILFKVQDPVDIKEEDFETDFFHLLKDVPLRSDGVAPGIQNKGNSCYADSALQMLFRISAFRKVVANLPVYHARAKVVVEGILAKINALKAAENCTDDEKLKLISERKLKFQINDIINAIEVFEGLGHMFYQLQTLPNSNSASFGFEKTMQCMPGNFAGSLQQDADEYLSKISELLLVLIPESQHQHFLLNFTAKGDHRSLELSGQFPVKSEKYFKTSTFHQFSLAITDKSKTLDDLLNPEFKLSEQELKFEDAAKTPGLVYKTTLLTSFPDFIPIHLKRLLPGHKIIQQITIPSIIDFTPFIWPEYLNSVGSPRYRLKMFILHSGTCNGGHYVSYYNQNENGGDDWLLFNDSFVKKISRSELDAVINYGYLYYYERIGISP